MLTPLFAIDILCSLALVFLSYSLARISLQKRHPNSPPIAPSLLPWVGDLIHFLVRRTTLFEKYRLRYGPVYKFMVAGRYVAVVSSPMTVYNALNMPTKVFDPLQDKGLHLLVGLTDRLPDLVDLLHRSAFAGISRVLSGPRMMICTVPLSKSLYTSLQALVKPGGETTLSLTDYVVPNLHHACTHVLLGRSSIPDTTTDFHTMDEGVYFFLSGISLFAKKSLESRSRLLGSLTTYTQEVLEKGHIEGASPFVLDTVHQLEEGGYSVDESARLLAFVMWGAHSNLITTATAVMGHLAEDPTLYRELAVKMREAIAKSFSDLDSLFNCEPAVLSGPAFVVLDSIIYETLRLDSVSSIIREVKEDTYLSGEDDTMYHFTKGELVAIDVRGLHLDKAVFSRPSDFIYDRFVNPKTQSSLQDTKLIRTFGGGKSLCKGREYAKFVIKMLMLQTFLLFDIDCIPNVSKTSKEIDRSIVISRFRQSPMLRLKRREVEPYAH